MQNSILVTLHSMESWQASWLILDESGTIQQTIQQAPLQELSQLKNIENYELFIFFPAVFTLITSATLPKLARQRLMQALPFSLEEQLIDDVNELHFAVGPYQPDGTYPVVVISKKTLDDWLHALKEMRLTPAVMVPITLILPLVDQENTWSILIDTEHSAVRTGIYHGFACDTANLNTYLSHHLETLQKKPTAIECYTLLEQEIALATDIPTQTITVSPTDLLERIQEGLEKSSFINVLQGHYQTKRPMTQSKTIWKMAIYATGIWIGLAFLNGLISFALLHSTGSRLHAEMNRIYQTHFPGETLPALPREAMEKKLNQLSDTVNKNTFLNMLAETAAALSNIPAVKIENLAFQNQQMTVAVVTDSFATLEKATKALSQQGLSIKQQNAAIINAKVKANLYIERGKP